MWHRLTKSEYDKLCNSSIVWHSIDSFNWKVDDTDFKNTGFIWVYGLPNLFDLLQGVSNGIT